MTRNPPHLILCLCLSLLMALVGVQGALACPGQPATAVVACGHDGLIWLDAAGQPVKTGCRHCPDCTATGAVTLPPAPAPHWASRGVEALRLPVAPVALSAPACAPLARGPPLAARDLT